MFDGGYGRGVMVVLSVLVVAMREMGVVAGHFVVAIKRGLMGLVMVLGSVLMVLGGVGVVFGALAGVARLGVLVVFGFHLVVFHGASPCAPHV